MIFNRPLIVSIAAYSLIRMGQLEVGNVFSVILDVQSAITNIGSPDIAGIGSRLECQLRNHDTTRQTIP